MLGLQVLLFPCLICLSVKYTMFWT